jgi:enoyl-CoA hydratase/carnithine racemase
MKPLLRTFAFLGLAAAAIIIVASCSTQLSLPNQNVELILGDPNANPPKYVELKPGTAGKLHAALAKLKGHGGVCELTFLDKANGNPNPHFCETIAARLKTDRVIKSAAATNVGAVDAVANDPHLMYRIASPDPGDVSDVASLLK